MGDRVNRYQLGYAMTENEVVKFYSQTTNNENFEYNDALRKKFLEQHGVDKLTSIFKNLVFST